MSVSDAASSGDELKLLYAIRDRLAEAIEDCPVRDLSPLTRRLQDTVKDIRELQEVQKREGGISGDSGIGGQWNPTDEL
jgi:serine/threonine protein kinase HipA of HipAB toxin-antitoxin module